MPESDPVALVRHFLDVEEMKKRSTATEHDWAMTYSYRMSNADAEEFMTGARSDNQRAWKPERSGLAKMTGPDCLNCGRSWLKAQGTLCEPSKTTEGRAARRRQERQDAKLGVVKELDGEKLQEMLREIQSPIPERFRIGSVPQGAKLNG